MDVYLIRHGRAEDRGRFSRTGRDDSLRPLSAGGRRRLHSAMPGLKRLAASTELVLSSPYRRTLC